MGLPEDVADLIAEIERAGFLCYAVGGCVRDLLRGVERILIFAPVPFRSSFCRFFRRTP